MQAARFQGDLLPSQDALDPPCPLQEVHVERCDKIQCLLRLIKKLFHALRTNKIIQNHSSFISFFQNYKGVFVQRLFVEAEIISLHDSALVCLAQLDSLQKITTFLMIVRC